MSPRTLGMAKAMLEAMVEEMESDPGVFLMGEDIAKQGGIFGQYRGLSDRFGSHRVRDTPISESVLVSSAVGAALTGTRPVVDIHFSDFLTCAMDELVNQAAKMSYMFGGQARVPLVVRAPEGAVNSAAAQHSQSLESWFCHTPGWRVVAPATPADAKGLLKSAIRCDDPVLYLEHKALYTRKGEVPEGELVVPLGSARVARPGRDVTILSWSLTLLKALTAAEQLAEEGIEAEVVDLRSLAPLDMDTIFTSVRRTRRVVVAHEAVGDCGLGAEISARVGEHCFADLDAPVRRVTNPGLPIPFAPSLEAAVLPQPDTIATAVRDTVRPQEVAA
ncbi:alpha-ketoacid dehydrogenase subunit beta [Pseudonocardia spinosispora]|uniref:alpha-ketoacid dehydrogenase subunit beta n=1 Tax=Pseudonocardia spinosispora TaxID=103441 RepID=UPI0003F7D973|nr:alpha-ketoacid dehydrogenase subunit beta [Pseudonocardia spinosispora]